MSPSSTGESPHSASGASTRQYPLPTRDSFSIDISSASLAGMSNDVGIKSPLNLRTHRTSSFSRDGMLSAAPKSRHLSQSSDNRPDNMTNGQRVSSDEGSNPLKRRNTDAGVDYPRRRATIAVCCGSLDSFQYHDRLTSIIVRGLPIEKVPVRWNEAKMQAVH